MDYFQTTSHLKGKIYSSTGAAFIALPFFGGTRQIDVTEGDCLALPKTSSSKWNLFCWLCKFIMVLVYLCDAVLIQRFWYPFRWIIGFHFFLRNILNAKHAQCMLLPCSRFRKRYGFTIHSLFPAYFHGVFAAWKLPLNSFMYGVQVLSYAMS